MFAKHSLLTAGIYAGASLLAWVAPAHAAIVTETIVGTIDGSDPADGVIQLGAGFGLQDASGAAVSVTVSFDTNANVLTYHQAINNQYFYSNNTVTGSVTVNNVTRNYPVVFNPSSGLIFVQNYNDSYSLYIYPDLGGNYFPPNEISFGVSPTPSTANYFNYSSDLDRNSGAGGSASGNFSDDSDRFSFSGNHIDITVSEVPLPASAPMFGAALLALGAVGYGMKRKKGAAAA